jgi:glycosyltransferase involved in cell wall biosynthesis
MSELACREYEAGVRQLPLRIAVGIATSGRPLILARVLDRLCAQTRVADAVIVCGASPADVSGIDPGQRGLHCITSDRGLTMQRNAILRAAAGFDVVVFLDDDFVPGPRYLEVVEQIFESAPEVVVGTGHVVADGILGPGLAFEEALTALREDGDADVAMPTMQVADVYNAYGCNMAIRIAAVQAGGLAFDESLPLYGWLEDVDFSRRMAAYGRIVKIHAARGVHLGAKSGRQSGRRLGYSQVSNPLYLVRKGTCSRRKALRLMSRNLAANITKTLRPEPYVDRAGRLMGNIRALIDLMGGRLSPERALNL